MRRHEDIGLTALMDAWKDTRKGVETVIAQAIIHDFGSTRWDSATARQKGTFFKIDRGVTKVLDAFLAHGLPHLRNFFKEARMQEMLRTVYMMRQLLPDTVPVKLPIGPMTVTVSREAIVGRVKAVVGNGATFDEKMTAWLKAWKENLIHNLNLGALNQSELADAIAEVQATKVGSPAFHIEDAIKRLFQNEFLAQTTGEGGGHDDAMDINDEAPVEEIWQARSDTKVCNDCLENDGKTRDEIEAAGDDDVHGYGMGSNGCRCSYQIRPKAWGDVGGAKDDSQPSSAMLIRGPSGQIGAAAIISYQDWITPNLQTIIKARKAAGLM